ncbi:unnamed protein product, partial [Chrysoparadoxa australica]
MGLGVGVIGCGRIGDIHATTLAYRIPDADLIAVTDIFEEAGARVVANTGGSAKYYKDWKEMVADPEVEAVVIGSPTQFHAEQITECAKLGKHIFCEKPISFDLNTIEQCMADVDASGVKLMLGFQRRFDSNFRTIRQKVEAGEVGDVRTFHITSRDPSPPPIGYLKQSGGVFLDMSSHDIDMARFLVGNEGDEIEEVYAVAKACEPETAEADDFDTTTIMLKFKSGIFGTIENSRTCAFGYDQRVEVFGEKGSVSGLNRSGANVATWNKEGVSEGLPFSFFMDRYQEAYVNIMRGFVQYATSNDPNVVKDIRPAMAYEGKITVLVGMAARKSVREGRPVKISEL